MSFFLSQIQPSCCYRGNCKIKLWWKLFWIPENIWLHESLSVCMWMSAGIKVVSYHFWSDLCGSRSEVMEWKILKCWISLLGWKIRRWSGSPGRWTSRPGGRWRRRSERVNHRLPGGWLCCRRYSVDIDITEVLEESLLHALHVIEPNNCVWVITNSY